MEVKCAGCYQHDEVLALFIIDVGGMCDTYAGICVIRWTCVTRWTMLSFFMILSLTTQLYVTYYMKFYKHGLSIGRAFDQGQAQLLIMSPDGYRVGLQLSTVTNRFCYVACYFNTQP